MSSWQQRMLKWQMKAAQFLRGRYARIDQLNRTLLISSMVLFLLNLFLPTNIARWIAYGLLIFCYYRFFSKKIYPRANENTKYVQFQQKITKRFSFQKERFQQRKTFKYFRCTNCSQQLRAPKGRGKIKVTCSACKTQFIKKV